MSKIRDFAYGSRFQNFIIAVIIFNAIIIGIDTYESYPILRLLEWICVWIFVVEIVLKMSTAPKLSTYFRDPWNLFDIIVVGVAFIPVSNGIGPALRILRVLRVLRLIHVMPEMRLIVSVLWKSLISMTHIGLLMGIGMYIYAVVGVKLFGDTQAEYATLHEAFFSLFRSLTAEDWTDLRYDGIEKSNYWVATIYHVSWILVGTFVMINLVVGAILNNYNEVQEIEARKNMPVEDMDARIVELMGELNQLMEARVTHNKLELERQKLSGG